MRPILLTIIGSSLMVASMLAVALALTPRQCDRLAEWVYDQAQSRDGGARRSVHEQAVREANADEGADVLAMLLKELAKVYDDGLSPIAASMDSRYECYRRRGEIGTEVKQEI